MKNFREIREKTSTSSLEERKNLSYEVKDMKSAEFIKNELSSLVKANFDIKKKGSRYMISASPKTSQDEKIIRSFMDDAKIEMIKDEFVRGLMKSKMTNEDISLENFQGEIVEVKSDIATKIIDIHDTLNKDNQELFMEMIIYSQETLNQMISFCETYSGDNK